jgi:hypothetical protein
MYNCSPLPLVFCLDLSCVRIWYLMLFVMLWSMMMSICYDLWSMMWPLCSTGRHQYMMQPCFFLY